MVIKEVVHMFELVLLVIYLVEVRISCTVIIVVVVVE